MGCFLTIRFFRRGGGTYKKWENEFSNLIFLAFTNEGIYSKSWPKLQKGQFVEGGRIVSTALNILFLEIMYRYKSVMK
jgi:hypothetical protein